MIHAATVARTVRSNGLIQQRASTQTQEKEEHEQANCRVATDFDLGIG